MNLKENYMYVLFGVIVGLIVFSPFYIDDVSVTGNSVLNTEDLTLFNCVEENGWKICDVEYPNNVIEEKGYKAEIM